MSKLAWDPIGERRYETGVDRGVLYPVDSAGAYPKGAPWNGLITVEENPSGAEPTAFYANNGKYLNLMSAEEFAATIKAYTYPDEFEECNGMASPAKGVYLAQQTRKGFGFTYRTLEGTDTLGTEFGYTIHLVYGCMAQPSSKSHNTVNENVEATELSWEITTTPVPVEGYKPTAHMPIKSWECTQEQLTALENILYGTEDTEARLPLPDEVITLFKDTPAAG